VPEDRSDEEPDAGLTAAERLLAAILNLPPETAARIRAMTPTRVRPRPQTGPTADYGDSPE
jgi:hypothetical protein